MESAIKRYSGRAFAMLLIAISVLAIEMPVQAGQACLPSGGATINLDDTAYMRINYQFQLYGAYRDTGSGKDGTEPTTDFYFRRNRLTFSGVATDKMVRAINNIVDATNYVMLEMGQPLHAFDFELLEEKRIVVRTAAVGESFTTLDGVARTLPPESLMICDGKKPVALAGIMCGLNSEVGPQTKNILLESAYFDPMGIRRTSKRMGLSTEASIRFERGIDPNGCLRAANRAAALMVEMGGGKVSREAVDVYPKKIEPAKISLRPARVNQILGTGHGWEWSDLRGSWVYWPRSAGAGVHELRFRGSDWRSGTWTWSPLTDAGNQVVPDPMTVDNGVYSRFRLVRFRDAEIALVVNRVDGPVYAFRMPETGPSRPSAPKVRVDK